MLPTGNLVLWQCRWSVVRVMVCLIMLLAWKTEADDADALLSLKSSIDPENLLPWDEESKGGFCGWVGVRMCIGGRVRKLVLEFQNLSGILDGKSLNALNDLRVFSVKRNSLQGRIPDLSGLSNLKSLFLSDNNFSGGFPESIAALHRLKVVALSGNRLTGPIPESILKLSRLHVFYIQDNQFTGSIPPFNQTSLAFLNVSNNNLSGQIPTTSLLSRFNASSFSGNIGLCGDQLLNQCELAPLAGPSEGDFVAIRREKGRSKKWIPILVGSVGGFLLAMILLGLIVAILLRRRHRRNQDVQEKTLEKVEEEVAGGSQNLSTRVVGEGRGFSWDSEGLGALVFVGGETQMGYTLEDLLKASAETLGRGTVGSTYKAMLESGFIVTVKRLKDASYPGLDEFRTHMSILGRLRHPNLVPLRAYFQAKEERLLVYDYFPNGSLFSLLHGTRVSNSGKPLHWTSCLKIAEDLASGLLCIHQNSGLVHGNLKSSNVLLGPEFESCITDYGLSMLQNPDVTEEPCSSSLFYRAPEIRGTRKVTQQSDVYSFGNLLLELLTGKTPYQDLVQEHGSDIPRWVRSVRDEEIDSGDDPSSGNEAGEEKLQALVRIAMACVSQSPENRPSIVEVLKMIREARGETHVSSNSSDHSPGRWSDTIQSLPREEQLSM